MSAALGSRCLLVLAVLCTAVLPATAADSLQVTDSLAPDSMLALPDSLAARATLTDRWLLPMSLILLSGATVYLLYSVRSR